MASITAIARVFVETDGRIRTRVNTDAYYDVRRYYEPLTAGIGNSSWIRVTELSGSVSDGSSPIGVVLSLSTARSWQISCDAVGDVVECQIHVSISNDPDGINVTSQFNVLLHAEVN